MVNKVLNAITEALNAEFGSNYRIYTEDVPQGLEPPCFLVTSAITPTRQKQTHVTYLYSPQFVIQYFPGSENGYRSEIHNVIDRLDECLENISVTWATKKTKKTLTETTDVAIVDGVLSYTIRVPDVYFKIEGGDLMEEIQSQEIEVSE